MIIKAWLRGLLPTHHIKYGARSIARRELILSVIAQEEEHDLLRYTSQFNLGLLAPRLAQVSNDYKDFAEKQQELFILALDKYLLKKAVIVNESDRLKNSTDIQNLIHDFKYMKKHGIFDKLREAAILHRIKAGVM